MTEMREVLEKLELIVRRTAERFANSSFEPTRIDPGHVFGKMELSSEKQLLLVVADEINRAIKELPEPPPCIYESIQIAPGVGRARCRTHGFDCPNMRPTNG
jgi:hypothetical protein